MKTSIVFTLCMLMVLHASFGQIGSTLIELDQCNKVNSPLSISSNGQARKWLYVKTSESLRFQVKNVNPNSLTVAINGDFADVLSEPGGGPDIAKELTAPSSTTPSSNTGGSSGLTTATTAEEAIDDIEQRIIPDLDIRISRIDDLNNLLNNRLTQDCFVGVTNETFKKEVKDVLNGQTPASTQIKVKELFRSFTSDLAIIGTTNSRYNDLKATLDDYQAELSKDAFDAIKQKIEKIARAIPNSVVSSELIPPASWRNNDVVRFTVEKTKSSGAKTTATYDVYIVGGIKIDVSAGVFVNGLVDENYVGQQKPTSTSTTSSSVAEAAQYKPVLDAGDKVSFAAGSLINIYPRFNIARGGLNFGLSFGASVGNRVNYYGGVSALIGRTQRIVLTYGLAFGKVKRLSELYTDRDKYYTVESGQFATREVIDHNWFFGLTYNLGGMRSTDAKK